MTAWADLARQTIERVALTLPEDMPFTERRAAIEAAYPFGERSHWPYRAWCKARRKYLARFDPRTRQPGPLFSHLPRDPTTGRPLI